MPLMRTPQEIGPRLEPGTYEMVVTRVREDHIASQFNPEGQNVIRFNLQTTDIVGSDGEPVELDAIANDSLTPSSKLTRWLNAFGVGVTPGVALDLEKVIGRKCLANIVIEDRGEKGQWNKIDDMMAPPRRGPRNSPVEQSSAPPAGASDSEVYHPAVKPGEPVTDATLISDIQTAHLRTLLGDVYGSSDKHIAAGYAELAKELTLPDLMSQMRVPELSRAIDALLEKKAALA